MSAEHSVYVDSSALVKLAVEEPESRALRAHLRRRSLVASALVRTEVARSLLPFGEVAVVRGSEVLARVELIRINDRVLRLAGELRPLGLRSLDAIHLATASLLGPDLSHVITYDDRMARAATAYGFKVVAPS